MIRVGYYTLTLALPRKGGGDSDRNDISSMFQSTPHNQPSEQQDLFSEIESRLPAVGVTGGDELYKALNAFRDWFNQHFEGFEVYLEDVWNDNAPGETHFEYIVRSKITKNETPPLAADVYSNHQDERGVWHLGDYQHSKRSSHTSQSVIEFIQQNGWLSNPVNSSSGFNILSKWGVGHSSSFGFEPDNLILTTLGEFARGF